MTVVTALKHRPMLNVLKKYFRNKKQKHEKFFFGVITAKTVWAYSAAAAETAQRPSSEVAAVAFSNRTAFFGRYFG
jgi:hypothetical protein